MTASAPAVVVALAWMACGVPAPTQPDRVALGETFRLGIGESARIDAESLEIGFDDVAADSRCPRGEQCVWEGDALVRVWLRKARGDKATRELHTAQRAAGTASFEGYELRLVRLDPYPVAGRTIARADYVASLALTRGSSAAPDR